MLSIVVCDDDVNFINYVLKPAFDELLEHNSARFTVQYFNNPLQVFEFFKAGSIPDILFLDIEMPDMNGKVLAGKLRAIDRSFSLVFISSYEKEVFDSFKYQTTDFIPKNLIEEPYSSRLLQIMQRHSSRQLPAEPIEIIDNSGQLMQQKFLLNNILGFYLKNRSIYLMTYSEEFELVERTFKKIEDSYLPRGFAMSHRNYLINVSHIKAFRHGELLLDNEKTVPVSVRCLRPLRDAFNKYLANGAI